MSPDTAQEISGLMLEISGKLDRSLLDVREQCTEEEFHNYRRAVGLILSDILVEVLNPLYKQHPNLKPPGMD